MYRVAERSQDDKDILERPILVAPTIVNCAVGESREVTVVNINDPPENRLRAFNRLYEENAKHLHMPKPVNHPLNYRRAMDWATHHCDSTSVKFAEAIIANTAYVSFGDFIAAISRICASFKHHYVRSSSNAHDTTKFVLVIPFDMTKSNIWVSLLMWPELRDIVNDIDFDITSVYNRYMTNSATARVVCIVCDDCAYTGNQLLGYCTLDPHRVEYPNKPKEPSVNSPDWISWDAEVRERTREIEAELDTAHFSINLLIPYMSTHAQQNIMDRRFLMVPKDVQIFKLFRERVNIHDFAVGAIREFESTFQYHSNITAIYFDHKIADAISTFNKIYLLAPVFGCGNLKKSVCFIDGCEKRKLPNEVNIYDIYVNIEDVLPRGAICPSTFYKSIKYTLGGHPVSDLCIYNALLSDSKRRSHGARAEKKK
jgi:hypothetical protein